MGNVSGKSPMGPCEQGSGGSVPTNLKLLNPDGVLRFSVSSASAISRSCSFLGGSQMNPGTPQNLVSWAKSH